MSERGLGSGFGLMLVFFRASSPIAASDQDFHIDWRRHRVEH